MSLRYSKLKIAVFLYISLPVFLFLAFFLRLSAALPCMAAYAAMLCFALCSGQERTEKKSELPVRTLAALFLAVLLWTYLGGLNGHWFQTTDWDCRNAIFRDLITHEWPVHYKNGSAMVYYIGHWLPAALAAKLFLPLGGLELAWAVGQNLLWLWTAAGIYLVLLLLLTYHEAKTPRQVLVVVLLFVFFSGMDIIGAVITRHAGELLSPATMHLEWWTSHFQFSSLTTCIYWVFNQTVIPWLTVMCFLFEKTPCNYIFLCIACLASGPFPLVGLAVLMAVRGVEYLLCGIRKRADKRHFAALLLPGNLLGMLLVVPVYLVYYMCNNANAGTSEHFAISFKVTVVYFLVFFVLEAGVYLVLLYRDHKHDALYYGVLFTLLLFPHYHIGASIDFCMRSSIPAVFLMMVFCGESLLKHMDELKRPLCRKNICTAALVLCLLVGAVTPCVEIGRGIFHVLQEGSVELAYDPIYSFETQPVMYNFSTGSPDETLFFRYLARK